MPDVSIREATRGDADKLWLGLAWAAQMPGDGSDGDVEKAKSDPDLARYVEGFGGEDDLGFVAQNETGEFLGAAWIRMMHGYGYIDDQTPELSIGVAPDVRGRGIGARLLEALLTEADERHEAVCLSVRADNPAKRLYERHGFEVVEDADLEKQTGTTSVTMIRICDG